MYSSTVDSLPITEAMAASSTETMKPYIRADGVY